MTLVGDAAEREVAMLLARMGFDLVYQSRASRGSFAGLLDLPGHVSDVVQPERAPVAAGGLVEPVVVRGTDNDGAFITVET